MAIGAIERNAVKNPTTMKVPLTWGDLQKMNTIIPGAFGDGRRALLADPGERGSAFSALDSTLAQAGWSRRDTDDPNEPLPSHLKTAATELLDLMEIRSPEGIAGRMTEIGQRVIARLQNITAGIRSRLRSRGAVDS